VSRQLVSSAEPDTVDVLLRDLRVTSTLYCRSTLSAPWGFGVPATGREAFHIVVDGDCCLEVDGQHQDRQLHAGDLVILPATSTGCVTHPEARWYGSKISSPGTPSTAPGECGQAVTGTCLPARRTPVLQRAGRYALARTTLERVELECCLVACALNWLVRRAFVTVEAGCHAEGAFEAAAEGEPVDSAGRPWLRKKGP
jgi:hypothetical protein